jgi:uncharacterized protein (TIGR00369 family)
MDPSETAILLHTSRHGVRFPDFRRTQSLSHWTRREGAKCQVFSSKCGAADSAAKGHQFMKHLSKLSKADLARADERLRHSNPSSYFGFQLVKAERGRAVIRMPVLDLHKQIHRVVHGGVLAMLADTAGGFAAFLAEPEGTRVVTIEMKINFLEAVEHGAITADARVIRQGRTVTVVDCNVTDADRRLVGKALMTFAISQKK